LVNIESNTSKHPEPETLNTHKADLVAGVANAKTEDKTTTQKVLHRQFYK